MKAVIVDLNGNDAVALRDDGQFIKLRNSNYRIGQEILMQAQTFRFPKQAAVAASAALVVLAGGGIGSYTWSNPISYVSLDINPSIAYSLNGFNRVIAVSGMNDEGTAVVDAIGASLKNVDITTALTITVEQLSTDAYLDAEDTNYMVIGVYSDKDSKADALMSTVDAFSADTVETCSITTVNVSKETKETADSYGITVGKMALIEEVASAADDPDTVDPAVLADMTVAELEQTKEAAASGASVEEAVASVSTTDDTSGEIAADSDADDAVASDDKASANADTSSSSKKEDSANTSADNTTSADNSSSASEGSQNTSSDNNTTTADNSTDAAPANSTDKTGSGSSEKKDTATASDAKDNTTSSEKKDSESSSSEKQETSSSEKKNDVSEDSEGQVNSNIEIELSDKALSDVTLPEPSDEVTPVTPSAVEIEQ